MNNKTVTFEQHPIATRYTPGAMPEDEFEAFAADIKKRGQIYDVHMYQGKVLDGMSRCKALTRHGMTVRTKEYTGDDPAGFVIAVNILRRKSGTTQRALAGAQLNLEHGLSQDEASKQVGVSKVHINLVVQALKSKNARVLKMLEDPNLTRERLHEELMDCNIVRSTGPITATTTHLSAAGATAGLNNLFANQPLPDGDDDFLADPSDTDELAVDLDETLGPPPSAGGKVISFKPTTEGGLPVTGVKPTHPERRSVVTIAGQLAEKFRGFTEIDQIAFMQMTWPVMRKLLKTAGLSVDGTVPAAAKPAPDVVTSPPSKKTSAQAQVTAQQAIDKAAEASKGASKPRKVLETAEATQGAPRGRKTA